jgi:hypothetical protein
MNVVSDECCTWWSLLPDECCTWWRLYLMNVVPDECCTWWMLYLINVIQHSSGNNLHQVHHSSDTTFIRYNIHQVQHSSGNKLHQVQHSSEGYYLMNAVPDKCCTWWMLDLMKVILVTRRVHWIRYLPL